MSASTSAPALPETSTPYSAAKTFDALGAGYEAAFAAVPAQLRSLSWLLTQLPPASTSTRPSHILDLGSGTGRPAAATLAAAGHAVVGVDVSPRMVELARERVPGATFEVGDARVWEPPAAPVGTGEGGYDAAVAYFSFIAGVSRAEIAGMFGRIARWLRPGGLFVFGTVAMEGENMAVKWLGRDVVVSGLSLEETLAGLRNAGFEVLSHEVEGYLPRGVEAGVCEAGDLWEEEQVFVYARKM